MTQEPRKGTGQARPGNDNAKGHAPKNPNPAWFDLSRKLFERGMATHGPRENYKAVKGRYYAGDTPVTVHMPKDWRKIKDPARPIVVTAHGKQIFCRDHEEARLAASLETKKIHDAERAARLKDSPFSDPIISADLMRALKTL